MLGKEVEVLAGGDGIVVGSQRRRSGHGLDVQSGRCPDETGVVTGALVLLEGQAELLETVEEGVHIRILEVRVADLQRSLSVVGGVPRVAKLLGFFSRRNSQGGSLERISKVTDASLGATLTFLK